MSRAEEAPDADTALAQNAGSVRLWLVRWFARRVRDQAEVEDMVQEVFTRIAARDSTKPVERLAGYVLITARTVMADRARRAATHMDALHVPLDDEQHGDVEIDPERVFIGKEELRSATAALLSLPERTRTVFILRRLEGCRHKEIAVRLGISVSAVEKHVVRAMQHLEAERARRRGP
jgi:RNA polymerase sigma-70 factor (ECF subfamily)